MNEPLLSLLGMARRAGRLALGTEASKEALAKKNAKAVFVSSDTAARTEKEFRFFCADEIPVRRLEYTSFDVSHAVGQKVGVVTLCDEGFAKRAIELIGSEI